jgi:hypothetical protein
MLSRFLGQIIESIKKLKIDQKRLYERDGHFVDKNQVAYHTTLFKKYGILAKTVCIDN